MRTVAAALALTALAAPTTGQAAKPSKPHIEKVADQLRKERQQARHLRAENRRLRRALEHDGSVTEAIRLASFIYRVPESTLRRLAFCESRMNPGAVNSSSGASGLLQFLPSTWAGNYYGRAGFSVLSPYANALGAAQHISKYGTGAWECA